jgi:glycosyltransferase involved in cell wall biosynthesis
MNPGHTSVAHYEVCPDHRHSLLGEAFSLLRFRWSKVERLLKETPPAALLLTSWHPWNFRLARLTKILNPEARIIAWLHEPYKDEKKVYRTKAPIIYLVELCQTLSLRYVDAVVLHSRRGLKLFDKRYPRFRGQKYMIPLQFQDDGLDQGINRRYVSFIGRADRAKGIEAFFDLVKNGGSSNLAWEYQIVTSSNIQGYMQRLSQTDKRQLHVINKSRLSDRELRLGAANSLAVLALYKETMQSGVIPVSLMKGTPVIGTDIEGITEWIQDGKTGVIVSRNPSSAEIMAAIRYIQENFSEMSAKCRQYYLATFDDRNWDRYYGWLASILE